MGMGSHRVAAAEGALLPFAFDFALRQERELLSSPIFQSPKDDASFFWWRMDW